MEEDSEAIIGLSTARATIESQKDKPGLLSVFTQGINMSILSAQVHVGDRHTAELQVYSFVVFEKVMKKHSINCITKLADQGIDCLATFCTMTEAEFKSIGLGTKQSRECAKVAKLLQNKCWIQRYISKPQQM